MRIYYPGAFAATFVAVGLEPSTIANPDAKVTGSFQVVLHTKPFASPFNGFMAREAKLRVPTRMHASGYMEVGCRHWYDGWDHFNFTTNPLGVDVERARREGVRVTLGDYELPVAVR
jgi:hypothetical protein